MRKVEITCDYCKKDISETDSMPAYRIVLQCEQIPHNTDFIYSAMVYPPIDHTMHFCGLGCLKKWLINDGGVE